jgi:hypothetical protein
MDLSGLLRLTNANLQMSQLFLVPRRYLANWIGGAN